ncbi:hypothetical protein MANY_47440 [Mycolicibacterium anyangense]|jgi:amicyanin|uniref:EfeO-type cupredoxin-like domain-containing protein n=1 Tax=Mycolicibacterium anyangense TaxID=1431246 RepID=A0A6N4WGU4_9MYCO|nr:cupredoxin family copper-binding protein [Mycolicibacterium anyangense]BBZ79407.1 hypothetical protein MANY_47440 [Mycolicibacterium anyangense]
MTRTRAGTAAVLATAGITALVACSHPVATPAPDFGANGGTPVGMSGMTGMPVPSSQSSAPATSAQQPVVGTAVDITNFAFTPATLTVKVGDTVTWTNHDEEPHTVVADDGSFHSPGLGTNDKYTFTFTAPGSFSYLCSIHPFMHGTVVVSA